MVLLPMLSKDRGNIFGKIQAFYNVEILLFMEAKTLGDG